MLTVTRRRLLLAVWTPTNSFQLLREALVALWSSSPCHGCASTEHNLRWAYQNCYSLSIYIYSLALIAHKNDRWFLVDSPPSSTNCRDTFRCTIGCFALASVFVVLHFVCRLVDAAPSRNRWDFRTDWERCRLSPSMAWAYSAMQLICK